MIDAEKKLRISILIWSIVLFTASLTQNAYCTKNSCQPAIGCLFMGMAGVFLPGATSSWLANPLLLAGWITFYKKKKISLLLSFFATCLALSFLLFRKVAVDEAENFSDIISHGAGYFIWLGSTLVMFIGNLLVFFLYSRNEQYG